jgi:hypothetical protein
MYFYRFILMLIFAAALTGVMAVAGFFVAGPLGAAAAGIIGIGLFIATVMWFDGRPTGNDEAEDDWDERPVSPAEHEEALRRLSDERADLDAEIAAARESSGIEAIEADPGAAEITFYQPTGTESDFDADADAALEARLASESADLAAEIAAAISAQGRTGLEPEQASSAGLSGPVEPASDVDGAGVLEARLASEQADLAADIAAAISAAGRTGLEPEASPSTPAGSDAS